MQLPTTNKQSFGKIRYSITICLSLGMTLILPGQTSYPHPAKISHPNAHAHNDYEHTYPLWEALHHGFSSVEADVWLINQTLYVKHSRPLNLAKTPSLENLYLKPLFELIQKQERVYPQSSEPFFLMIDIKARDTLSYQALQRVLIPYKSMLIGKEAPVKIFLSGARPIALAKADTNRWVGIDGRPEDLGKGYSPDFMPVISQRFSKIIKWKGKSEISSENFQTLKTLADSCHAEGKKLRLWAIPETTLCWETLLKAGVDLINADRLQQLDKFLRERKAQD